MDYPKNYNWSRKNRSLFSEDLFVGSMIYEKQQYYISWEVLDMFHKKHTQYSWKQSNKCISFSQDINSQAVQYLVLNDVYSFIFGFYVSKYKIFLIISCQPRKRIDWNSGSWFYLPFQAFIDLCNLYFSLGAWFLLILRPLVDSDRNAEGQKVVQIWSIFWVF